MLAIRTFGGLAVEADGFPLSGAAVQRKTLALLALLAGAGRKGLNREKITAYLWPESDAERGRNLLNQACYALRRDLGAPDLFLGTTALRLNPEAITSDVETFEDALSRGDRSGAVAQYAGPFLDGFYVTDAGDFERWVEGERARHTKRVCDALESLALEATAQGDHRTAAERWRRFAHINPLNSSAVLGLMRALDDAGERAEAIRTGEAHAAFVRAELDAEPASDVAKLLKKLRLQTGEGIRSRTASSAGRAPATGPGPARAPEPALRDRRSRRVSSLAAIAVVVLAGAGITALALRAGHAAPILAVGTIRDYAASDSASLAPTIAEMLATNLARVGRLQVLSTTRVYEFLDGRNVHGDETTAMAQAARQAHATQLLQGALYQRPDGRLRLELQRVDLQSGVLRQAYAVEGLNPFEITDSATARIAADLGAAAESLRVSDVTTQSLVAYRLYQEGLHAFFTTGAIQRAERLFVAAVAEDSNFVLAHYYAAVTEAHLSMPNAQAHFEQAARLADRASDRIRLLVRADWAMQANEPSGLALAETLAIRYPSEPEGRVLLGGNQLWAGDFLGAIRQQRQVIAMDSAKAVSLFPECRVCQAWAGMVMAYELADSFAAAERTARQWLRLQPQSGSAWHALGTTLEYAGRYRDAVQAYREESRFNPAAPDEAPQRSQFAIRSADFERANQLVADYLRDAPPDARGEALWTQAIALRAQGRLREAMVTARQIRASAPPPSAARTGPPFEALTEALILFEAGHSREAAALFDSLAHFPAIWPGLRAKLARNLCWMLTHEATALAAAGDTAKLAILADTVEAVGPRSAYGRDRLLHHHIRGLLLAARGRPAEAATEFRQAVFSLTGGYTRTNLELARALLQLKRPREAIGVLQPAFRGPLDASNLYVTHTELHEMLARAFDEAGERDSAIVHYRWVVSAWQHADPEFQQRLQAARGRLGVLAPR